MAGRQAKIITNGQLQAALRATRKSRYPARDRVMLLLSAKAGLRAAEIAGLTWSMLQNSDGTLSDRIAVADDIAKRRSGRTIPIHPLLRSALQQLARRTGYDGHVVKSERGTRLRASSVVNWFKAFYRNLGLLGCTSHSGRRTFITMAARRVSKAGGSIKDVQILAGHSSLSHTQRYIEGHSQAQKRLVEML